MRRQYNVKVYRRIFKHSIPLITSSFFIFFNGTPWADHKGSETRRNNQIIATQVHAGGKTTFIRIFIAVCQGYLVRFIEENRAVPFIFIFLSNYITVGRFVTYVRDMTLYRHFFSLSRSKEEEEKRKRLALDLA